ncbi:MAG: pirin family protein [Chitinophagaceae bacterium]|nr:pirin family protein [Chitinophagaceae bacterium]MCW5904252.1 pirin family protein [Chitinophagaceae bacterium]
MKTILHKAHTRGHANHGWLNSYHTFSFAGYYDEERTRFGLLRVLNDDTVAAGMGFDKHPHDNMEIVSIPLAGDLHHNDSTGRSKIIKQGDVQIMSAGSGITHSEMNANKDKEVQFLQIWIFPEKRNITPRYEQKTFSVEERKNTLQTVVAPDNANALWINQQAWFTLGNFDKDVTTTYQLHNKENGVYVFVINGDVSINDVELNKRDGLGITETDSLHIKANSQTEILLIEVPLRLNK